MLITDFMLCMYVHMFKSNFHVTILFSREEGEKLNLWVGLMNLENMYGSHDSLIKVFQRAVQQNEPKSVYYRLVNIYVTSDKIDVSIM